MTRDELNALYDVHKPVANGEPGVARSFFGRSRTTKAVVLVHFLDLGARPDPQEALARIEALGPEDRKAVLETCEVDGTWVVVTRFIWDFTTFDAWLKSLGRSPTRAEPAAPAKAPGEFTRLFGSPVAGPALADPGPNAAPASPPGEFTRLFNQQARPPGPAPPSPAHGVPRALSDSPTEQIPARAPGEFTKLFKAPSAPEPPAAPVPGRAGPGAGGPPSAPRPPEPAKPGPGEFTRLFGGPVGPPSTGSPAAPGWPPAAPAPLPTSQPVFPEPSPPLDDLARRLARGADLPPVPSGGAPAPEDATRKPEPGDFTRMFGGVGQPPHVTGPRTSLSLPASGFPSRSPDPLAPPPSLGSPAGPSGTDYLARLHGAPIPPAGPPAGMPLAPPPPSTVPKGAAGPSEFTRALQRVSSSGVPAETDGPEDEPAETRSALPVVLIICGVLLVLGLAVVLYFLLTME